MSKFYNSPEFGIHILSNIPSYTNREQHQKDVAAEVQGLDCYHVRDLKRKGFEPSVIVDIGGHIGTFGMFAHREWPHAKIISYEPADEYFAMYCLNCPTASVYNSAVFGFYGYEDNRELHPSSWFEKEYRERKRTNAVSVKDLFDQNKISKIDFLKIDCEEGEVNIFTELAEMDRIKDIDVISGEWHFQAAKNQVKGLLTLTHDVEINEQGSWNHFHAINKQYKFPTT